jgi:anti-anti-sigma factor
MAIRRQDGVVILDIQGRVTIGPTNDLLSRELRTLVSDGERKLLVNLAGVPQLDSSGISTIVRTFVTIRRESGTLKLLHATGHVQEVLDMTHLTNSIPTFQNEAEAIESFR